MGKDRRHLECGNRDPWARAGVGWTSASREDRARRPPGAPGPGSGRWLEWCGEVGVS